jgi:glutaredoxin
MSETPSITLYRLEGCPYCEFVVDRLDELGPAYDSVWVEGIHSRRNEVHRVSGQRQVPVVVDEATGVTMSQSARIIEYLETTYGEAASPDEVEAPA